MEKDYTIETETNLTYEIYKKYYMFSIFKGRFYKSGPVLFYLIAALGFAASLYSGLSYGFNALRILSILVFVILVPLVIFLTIYYPKKYFNSSRKLFEVSQKYKFTNEYIVVESNDDVASGTAKIKYSALNKVYELDDVFYIFISVSQAYIIEKYKLQSGEIQQLRKKFILELGKKYFKYSKD